MRGPLVNNHDKDTNRFIIQTMKDVKHSRMWHERDLALDLAQDWTTIRVSLHRAAEVAERYNTVFSEYLRKRQSQSKTSMARAWVNATSPYWSNS